MTKEAGMDIGRGLENFKEVDCNAFKSDQAKFLRVRVEVPLNKPLWHGALVMSLEGDEARVAFHYERLVGWCFACSKVGHNAKDCETVNDVDKTTKSYGEWMKINVRTYQDNLNSNQPSPQQHQSRLHTQHMPNQSNPITTSPTPITNKVLKPGPFNEP